MSDLLAIIEDSSIDDQLVDEIVRRHPDRVTVLLDDGDSDSELDDTPRGAARRDRLTQLLTAIEQRSGAVVVGLAGDREQLRGWRFDRVVGSSGPAGAFSPKVRPALSPPDRTTLSGRPPAPAP